eukprot:2656762-Rhodomonas_salina.2
MVLPDPEGSGTNKPLATPAVRGSILRVRYAMSSTDIRVRYAKSCVFVMQSPVLTQRRPDQRDESGHPANPEHRPRRPRDQGGRRTLPGTSPREWYYAMLGTSTERQHGGAVLRASVWY